MNPSEETRLEQQRLLLENEEAPMHKQFLDRVRKDPLIFASMGAFATIVGVGAYKWKSRKTLDPAQFLIKIRVAAQGTAIGLLSLGMIYQMVQKYVLTDSKPKNVKQG